MARMKRLLVPLLLAAFPLHAQDAPLADTAARTAAVLDDLGEGRALPEDLLVPRTAALFGPGFLEGDWARVTEELGAPEDARILRVTPYAADGDRPALSAVDFIVFHEEGLICGYAIWQMEGDAPAIRRFQYGIATDEVLLSDEPGRSEALRGTGCTVLPNDMTGGPLR